MSPLIDEVDWLERCLVDCRETRVTVFGDFCLDAYWLVDPGEDELSVETGLPVRRVREQRYSLGGAGNVAANLAALEVGQVRAVGVIGEDIFGDKLLGLLADQQVECTSMLRSQPDWQTTVFAKPHVGGAERNRIDFGGFNELASETADQLAEALDQAASVSDVVILNQQVPRGVSMPEMIRRINAIVEAHPDRLFIADSRHRAELYQRSMLKLNAHEAARVCGDPRPLGEPISSEQTRAFAHALFRQTGRAVFVTRGAEGLLVADSPDIHEIPAIRITEPVDPVGAGDTVIAALAAALGGGSDAVTAATFANIAASVTVRKLWTTGTATPDEIRAVGPTPDYVRPPQ